MQFKHGFYRLSYSSVSSTSGSWLRAKVQVQGLAKPLDCLTHVINLQAETGKRVVGFVGEGGFNS